MENGEIRRQIKRTRGTQSRRKGKGKDKLKEKTSKKANQAVADDKDNHHSDSDLSAYLTGTSS